MDTEKVVVIGGSAGVIPVLTEFVSGLSPGVPAPILRVRHIGAHRSPLA